jgi:hypothetical protein
VQAMTHEQRTCPEVASSLRWSGRVKSIANSALWWWHPVRSANLNIAERSHTRHCKCAPALAEAALR